MSFTVKNQCTQLFRGEAIPETFALKDDPKTRLEDPANLIPVGDRSNSVVDWKKLRRLSF